MLNVGSHVGSFDKNALEMEISQLKHNISYLRIQNDGYKIEIAKQNRRYLELSKASTHSRNTSTEKLAALHDEIAKMKPSGWDTKVRMKPAAGVSKTQSKNDNQKSRVLPSKNVARPKTTPKYIRKTDITVAPRIVPQWKPTGQQFLLCDIYGPKKSLTPIAKPLELSPSVSSSSPTTVVQIVLWYLDSGCSRHMTGDTIISRVYYVEGLSHNLFSVGQFCDGGLEVAFRQHTCHIRNMDKVDLLHGSRTTNLYSISFNDMLSASLVCLLTKASSTKSWLWHRRLNHLSFGTLNELTRNDLVRGLPLLKYDKDHLCPSCQLEKSKKASHPLKTVNSNKEILSLLHMDLCGPMRIESINKKKYILVIVDDYTRFGWVRFLRTKDETPNVFEKFLKNTQLALNATVRTVRTDNGTGGENVT
ncbi:retrovirus-related pol polyprotein from transposon TNT 1-94 [Tanacetum coccineum]